MEYLPQIFGFLTGAAILSGVAWAIVKWGIQKYEKNSEKLEDLEEKAIVQKIESSVNSVRGDLKNLSSHMELRLERLKSQGDAQVKHFEEMYKGVKHIIMTADRKFETLEAEIQKLNFVTAKLIIHTKMPVGKVVNMDKKKQ